MGVRKKKRKMGDPDVRGDLGSISRRVVTFNGRRNWSSV